MLNSELAWAIEPGAFQDYISSVKAVLEGKITAGPVDDAQRAKLPVQVVRGTAIIPLQGVMLKNSTWITRFLGLYSTTEVRHAVLAAAADEQIDAIVLNVDSPGGVVSGTQELADAVKVAASKKKVIAQVGGTCCSAAYWVASQANQIFAGKNDSIGSIGVKLMLLDASKAFEQAGLKALPITTGALKAAGELGTEITEKQQEYFQSLVDGLFESFKDSVMSGRKMDEKAFGKVSDARVMLSPDAMRAGLIDAVQNMDATVLSLASPVRSRKTASARARLALTSQSLTN